MRTDRIFLNSVLTEMGARIVLQITFKNITHHVAFDKSGAV